MKRRKGFNPKRQILAAAAIDAAVVTNWIADACYGGNPEHKVRPGDYGLSPPRNPRPGKTLCDAERDIGKLEAQGLLKAAMIRGMVSTQVRGRWPQNVWAVSGEMAFEAQLQDKERGIYHGYPMPADDDFRDIVLKEWIRRG